MGTLSTDPAPPHRGPQLLGILALFALYGGLFGYLSSPSLPAGDGAAYLDQVQAGDLGRRTVHLGYLLQLWPATALAGDRAGALVGGVWGALALAAALALARTLIYAHAARTSSAGAQVGGPPPASVARASARWTPLVAPLFLLGLTPLWPATLFPEVYGPAAAALLAAAAQRLRGRAGAAALLTGLAITIHPGSAVWLPALAWLRPVVGPRRAGRFVAGALALPAAVVALCAPDYLFGERGVLAQLQGPRPWAAVQRAYRSLEGAAALLGVLPLLGLLHRRAGRALGPPLALGLGLSLLIDWRDDVPATLPALYLAAPLAAAGADVAIRRLGAPRVVGLAVVVLLVCQLGQATSRHDRRRRIADREVATLRLLAAAPTPPRPAGRWGERARYAHYVGEGTGPEHLQLPPGEPFPAGVCPDQRPRHVGPTRVFVCPRAPLEAR